ncbi:MAG TPA: SDR family oxidoreductase [Nocardioides sp.]|jgi:NAD(P)-dependent dehydrogenase (short-subunit alcohol dehydrogenase family)|uniref:SDR family NAD(P)-dependent oxidoreductase n=1 Tax=Nocardioides sp. TaxID=35761 RepID=UPI002E365D03|nr:SDR family oxidoreductase [Nocardioides sp.]HEX3930503.1 SDR family oxidoreductase [Nocardioides sp.]
MTTEEHETRPDRFDLAGKIVVITGSTQGVGFATAERMAVAGASVVLNNRSGDGAREAVDRLQAVTPGASVSYVRGDAMRADDMAALVESVLDRYGTIDVWVNNASPEVRVDFFERLTTDDWKATIDGKLYSVLTAVQAALPALKAAGGGSVVNVVSDAGRVGTAGESLVSAAYGAVIALTKSWAREFARYNVRVNCVSITLTRDTLGYDRLLARPEAAKIFDNLARQLRLGIPDPDDAAQAIVSLAAATRITGQTLSVNSGLSFPS